MSAAPADPEPTDPPAGGDDGDADGPGGGSSLPVTGAELAGIVLALLMLLGLGGALVVTRRAAAGPERRIMRQSPPGTA